MIKHRIVLAAAVVGVTGSFAWAAEEQVGDRGKGEYVVSTRQVVRAAGEGVEWHGRPVDLVASPDGKWVYVKDNRSVVVIDVAGWKVRQTLVMGEKSNGSMTGLAVTPDGRRVYVTAADSKLLEASVGEDGMLKWARRIGVPAEEKVKGARQAESYPCGVALSRDGKWALVCQSVANALSVVDLEAGKQATTIPVGMAPLGVVIDDARKKVYVSNWGGRRPATGDATAESAGSRVVVDERGIASTGTISVVDFEQSKVVKEIAVGLHPGAMVLSPDGGRLYVANANSDSVSVIDTASDEVLGTIDVKPDANLGWGSAPTGLAMAGDGRTLYVSLGGNNAVAVVGLGTGKGGLGSVRGFVPAGWYPGAVATDGKHVLVANVKGVGSRDPSASGKWNSHSYWGSVTKAEIPDEGKLAQYSRRVKEDALVPQALLAWERGQSSAKPAAIPARVGEPSPIRHVIYVIKENRTYDQILGDVKKGNGEPKLCTFGREVTPNHHKLAEEFVLLDNFYCNGVLSADGHAWVTQGDAVDYLEKSMGAWARSYPFSGDDALAFAPTGFIWDNALLHGCSFRNFGEFAKTDTVPVTSGVETYRDYIGGARRVKYKNSMWVEPLKKYTHPTAAGWSMRIPDQQRADCFIEELKQCEASGKPLPNLTILYLPCDHTSGTNPGSVAPESMVADNDLALGRVVDALSHSKFWANSVLFAIEDDPQAGFDHVDGHRSICVVASPYAKRGAVVSKFYNQTSVLHTMELILGLPPMNQLDAMAPVMREAFADKADLRPYEHAENTTPLDKINPKKEALGGLQRELAELSERQNFEEPDRASEDALNRILWHARMGYATAYPADLAGAHGKGLKKLGLKLDGLVKDGDDDDD